mgnify:CR=1 FL=1
MKLAFIGMGNMAYAILKGGCDRGFFNPAHVSAYDINTVRLAEVAAETVELAEETEAELSPLRKPPVRPIWSCWQ